LAIGSGEPAGYGGLIRAQHAKKLLFQAGSSILESRFQSQPPLLASATMPPPLPPLHPQPTAEPPPQKKQKQERQVHVYKGMPTALIKEMQHEDIRQALLKLNKPSSRKTSSKRAIGWIRFGIYVLKITIHKIERSMKLIIRILSLSPFPLSHPSGGYLSPSAALRAASFNPLIRKIFLTARVGWRR
jgi:hypothetical protein